MATPLLVRFALALLFAWSALALGVTVFAVLAGRSRTGAARHVTRGGRRWRYALAAVVLALDGIVLFGAAPLDGAAAMFALAALPCALGVLALAPGNEDGVYGERGVRRGWQARRYDELEGWRLSGEHLRFLVHGRLEAVAVPAADHEALRARLLELRPEQMSPFKA